jgi:hypothetical protein
MTMRNDTQEIVVEFDKDGNPTIEGVGFVGTECKKFTEALEADLGVTTSTVEKPEMRQTRSNVKARTVRR